MAAKAAIAGYSLAARRSRAKEKHRARDLLNERRFHSGLERASPLPRTDEVNENLRKMDRVSDGVLAV